MEDTSTLTFASSSTALPSNSTAQPPIQPPIVDSNTPNQPLNQIVYIGPYTIFLAIGIAVLVITRLIQIYQVKRIRRRQQRRAQERLNALANSQLLLSSLPVSLNGPGPVHLEMEDRIKLYERTFQRDQQAIVLTDDDFQPNNEETDEDIESGGEPDFAYDDEEPLRWLYLNLGNDSESDKDENQNQNQNEKTPEQHTGVDIGAIEALNDSAETPSRTKVSGTCIICFDDFAIGETVVYSENPSHCKHVFHEDCMTHFLASNSMRKKPPSNNDPLEYIPTTSYSENPCPTCRQPFCKVAHEDILLSVLLKSVQTVLSPNLATTEDGPATEGDAENPSNENGSDTLDQDQEGDQNTDDEIHPTMHPLSNHINTNDQPETL